MKIILVDDEKLLLEDLEDMIHRLEPNAETECFIKPIEALYYAETNEVDVAFIDVNMPKMNGLELAKQLKLLHPKINLIFCTGYAEYREMAYHELRCNGYITKPVKEEDIKYELDNLRLPWERQQQKHDGIYVQCFGDFEVFYHNTPVSFEKSMSKELFAYLVDKQGAMVKTSKIEVDLFESDQSHRSYISKMRKDIEKTFEQLGVENILIVEFGKIGIAKDKIECDYYNWLENKPEGIHAYNGRYMEQYVWASYSKPRNH